MFRVFIDSNVVIEPLLGVNPAATAILSLASIGLFQMSTSQTCIVDIERFLTSTDIGLREHFQVIITQTGLVIQPDAPNHFLAQVRERYLPVMHDVDDIPVLASALNMLPLPNVIISGNNAHFNDDVAERSGIAIMTAPRFLNELANILDTLF